MCLNEKLSYNIKVKSRNCELFVLKKNDFLRLSVNFKEFIEKFLQKSLMKYLRFNEEKKKIIKSIDDKNNSFGGLKNNNSQSKIGKINDLEMIDEEKEEEASEEFNVYDSHSGSEQDNKDSSENEENNQKKQSFLEEEDNKSSDSEKLEEDNINSYTRKGPNYKNNNADIDNNSMESEGDKEAKKGTILRSLMNKKKSGEILPQNNKSSKESKFCYF